MGRLVASHFVTLDDVMEDPGGAEATAHGGWAFEFERGEAGNAFKYDELMAADALLLGRRTYEGFAAAWPQMNGDEFGHKMNSMPKHVVTSTLRELAWQNSSPLDGDPLQAVSELKRTRGEILLAGSGRLFRALHENGLIDEYRLVVYPTTLGGGARLFGESAAKRNLAVLDVNQSADVVLMRLAPA